MNSDRRKVLGTVGGLVAAAVVSQATSAGATEHAHDPSSVGDMLDAKSENTCGTCQFWGGMRRVSEDKTMVHSQSLGWCNNPASPNFGKLTSANHEMKPGVWKRWPALG